MFCVKCQNDVWMCRCPDIAERLRDISEHSNWDLKMCDVCKEHVSQCRCKSVN